MSRVLIVEDDRDLARGLRNNLEIEGHEVEVAYDGASGLDRARKWPAELLVLDLTLPGLDGLRVLAEFRRSDTTTPVLILTAKDSEADKVRGLRLGADDYVTKPFGLMELVARIEALLRRGGRQAAAAIRFGAVTIHPDSRIVLRAGNEVALRPIEYELLIALAKRRGAVASRLDLLREVWGYAAAAASRTVDTHIFELRQKLEDDPTQPRHILTVWKVGYRLQE
jgi:two-component system alkaline phosphatase synthesis response regulator PhoP